MSDKFLFASDVIASNEILNPFIHHLELTTTYDKVRTGLFTIIILPIRLLVIAGLLILAWCLACIGLYGLTEEDLTKRPIVGWRRVIRMWICILGRSAYYAGGMHIRVKGKQVPRAEAPILVIAPHSTFLDAAIVYVTGFPSIIVRRESGMNPWLGKLINFTQPVYVGREDPDSRQKTIQDIINRTTSKEDWPQVLIFPEGTCTNRSCLITFKPGAFYPGVPVQPVLIRYPNKLDTVTWTWDGPGALKLLWLTLTRAQSNCEIEFLPVYSPNEEEKKDPKLYAHNVRNLMARALGVPTSEYSYEDCRLLKKAKALQLPQYSLIIRTEKLRSRLGLTRRKRESELIGPNEDIFQKDAESTLITKEDFAAVLGIHEKDHELEELFQLYSDKETKNLNLQNYLLVVHLSNRARTRTDMIRTAFECFGGILSKTRFQFVMRLVYLLSENLSEYIFHEMAVEGKSYITFDDYERYFSIHPEILARNNNTNEIVPFKKCN